MFNEEYKYKSFRCRTSQNRMTFIPQSVSLSKERIYPVFEGIELAGFKSSVNVSLLA